MKIRISTQFDCTATGITGHFRQTQLPMIDRAGQQVTDQAQWNRSRNQQRNFETLTQLIGLYTQPLELTDPVYCDQHQQWEFEFVVEFPAIFATELDVFGLLKQQSQNVPMIVGLTEADQTQNQLMPNVNIFFKELNITN